MRIPRTVKLGIYKYKIAWRKSIKESGNSCYGLCDSHNRVIYLDKELKNDPIRLKEVFIHECLHAISDCHGFNFNEDKVNRLGLAFTAFIIDNNLDFKTTRKKKDASI